MTLITAIACVCLIVGTFNSAGQAASNMGEAGSEEVVFARETSSLRTFVRITRVVSAEGPVPTSASAATRPSSGLVPEQWITYRVAYRSANGEMVRVGEFSDARHPGEGPDWRLQILDVTTLEKQVFVLARFKGAVGVFKFEDGHVRFGRFDCSESDAAPRRYGAGMFMGDRLDALVAKIANTANPKFPEMCFSVKALFTPSDLKPGLK